MKTSSTINVLFCGTGGQGVLKAAEILSAAASYAGYHVKKSEVHGMAQRGGSVESHVRFGKKVYSPLIARGRADFLVPFYKAEAVRLSSYLGSSGRNFEPELSSAADAVKEKKFLNTYMLGMLSRHLPLAQEHWIRALSTIFGAAHSEKNIRVFLNARERLS